MNLGKAIKLCRTQKNLSQSDLALASGISVSYLSLLEKGRRDPSFSTVKGISEALDIPTSILIFLASENDEMGDVSPELAEKLSHTALKLIQAVSDANTSV